MYIKLLLLNKGLISLTLALLSESSRNLFSFANGSIELTLVESKASFVI